MKMGFDALGLDKILTKAIKDAFNIENPTEIQEKVLSSYLGVSSQQDLLIRSKTGSGKTLSFLLPILQRLLSFRRELDTSIDTRSVGTLAVVIVPTRELAAQTTETLTKILSKLHGKDHWLVAGSLSGGDRRKSEKERLRKGLHIVVGTPGRILDHLQNTEKWGKVVERECRWIVFDEADRLLDKGFEKFIKEIVERIVGGRTNDGRPRMVLCSATVDEGRKDVFGYELQNPLLVSHDQPIIKKKSSHTNPDPKSEKNFTTQLEHFSICTPTKFRLAALVGFLQDSFSSSTHKIVLFSICCDTVDFLYSLFTDSKLKFIPENIPRFKLHGSLEHKERIETFKSFSNTKTSCLLVCTDVAARGLNLSNVTIIVQYDAPCDMVDYIHRAGRTARQQETGKSVLFLMPSEREYVPELEKKNLIIKSLKWESYVERISKTVDLTKSKASSQDPTNDDEDEERNVTWDMKLRIQAWLEKLQEHVKSNSEMFNLAKSSFLSFVRAYATHPSTEKAIFHIKKLHLGHLAATFLLAEAPKAVATSQMKVSKNPKNNASSKDHYLRGKKQMRNSMPQKRSVSEFDAGDFKLDYSKSKSKNRTRK